MSTEGADTTRPTSLGESESLSPEISLTNQTGTVVVRKGVVRSLRKDTSLIFNVRNTNLSKIRPNP